MNLGRGETIPWLIHELLDEHGEISSGDIARAADVTRQAAHYHLSRLVEAGELVPIGAGRGRRYSRSSIWSEQFETEGLEEHTVWLALKNDVAQVADLPKNAESIARFAFTEMLNNAIDHSQSETVSTTVGSSSTAVLFTITDYGIGVFEHVRRSKNLEDHVAAIQEISKGKLTTDPARHTGQGIFFTSKAVSTFLLSSNGWRWVVDNVREDSSIARVRPNKGTQVRFTIDPETKRSLKSLFDRYTDPETYAFDKSRTVVRLFEFDVSFVSRSEAKRLTRNLDQFREVIVDFQGVEEIGQGFADEIFRVWQNEHPSTRLVPANMNEAVGLLVDQARSTTGSG